VCADKGFDAVIPDEVSNWSNDSGFPITYQDQLIYNRLLARLAHSRGLTVGLKGDIEQVEDLVGDFDFTLNEECYQYKECTTVYNPVDGKSTRGYRFLSKLIKLFGLLSTKGLEQWRHAQMLFQTISIYLGIN